MATLNQLNAIDEALLTDLTAEQSAIVEGGKFIFIQGIQCIKAGADPESNDDTYMTFTDTAGKNVRALSETGMATGQYKEVNFATNFEGTGSVRLFDSDWVFDDPMGGFNVSQTNVGAVTRVSGSGSTYDVFYSVYA
jgi:hypothetical protein